VRVVLERIVRFGEAAPFCMLSRACMSGLIGTSGCCPKKVFMGICCS